LSSFDLNTALAEDIERARRFYERIFGLEAMQHDDRFCAFRVASDVLLLFRHGGSDHPMAVPAGVVKLGYVAENSEVISKTRV